MAKHKSTIGTIVKFIVLSVIACVIACVLFLAFLTTETGRGLLRDELNTSVTKAIPGQFVLKEITDLTFYNDLGTATISVRDLRFRDPDGVDVIHISAGEIDYDLIALVNRSVGIDRASLRGGKVVLKETTQDRLGIVAAFDDMAPASGDGKPRGLKLRNLHLSDFQLLVGNAKRPDVKLIAIDGLVHVARMESGSVEVRIEKAKTTVAIPSPLGRTLKVQSINGRVRADDENVVHLSAKSSLLGTDVSGDFDFYPMRKKSAVITIDDPNVIVSNLLKFADDLGPLEIKTR